MLNTNKSYRQALCEYAETINTQRKASASEDPQSPLVDRLRKLIASMSPEERAKPLVLEEIAIRLRGRQRPTARRGDVGTALRKLGYMRVRSFKKRPDGSFPSLWYPPTDK